MSTTIAPINNSGEIAGFYTNNGGQTFSGFLDIGRKFEALNDPGS
jgi:hypothetical protein